MASTLVDTIPLKLCGVNNAGAVYVYEVETDPGTPVTIRSAPTKENFRQVIVGWIHSASSDHTITFDLGTNTPQDFVSARTIYGVPLTNSIFHIGEATTAITVDTSVVVTATCYLIEASQFYLT